MCKICQYFITKNYMSPMLLSFFFSRKYFLVLKMHDRISLILGIKKKSWPWSRFILGVNQTLLCVNFNSEIIKKKIFLLIMVIGS